MHNCVIYGTGGFAREVCGLVQNVDNMSRYDTPPRLLGFLDDDPAKHGTQVHDLPVLGDLAWLIDRPDVDVIIGIGSPIVRKQLVERIRAIGPRRFPAAVDSSANIGQFDAIGEGSIICAGCILTTDYHIGDFVILNLACTVGHDATIGDFATISPTVNVSGNVHIGAGVEIGTGAALIPGVSIGDWSIVGAGAVVDKDLPPYVTAVGVPARVIKYREPGQAHADASPVPGTSVKPRAR